MRVISSSISPGREFDMSAIHREDTGACLDTINNGKTPPPNRFEGRFVSMVGNHMIIANMEGQKCSHTLARNATLTCDGSTCATENLHVGGKIRVTTRIADRNVVIGIESLDKHSEFAEES